MNHIIIKPQGGLCNRLRFIFSYIRKLIDNDELNKKNLIILWVIDKHCNGSIEDYFQSFHKNVNFIYENSDNLKVNVSSSGICDHYSHINYMKDLNIKLNKDIFQKIRYLLKNIKDNQYVSLHIRKTDLEKILDKRDCKNRTKDQEYLDFIKENKGRKIYLATDERKVQIKFKEMYSNRLFIYKDIDETDNLRQTTIEHAIIDIFMCVLSGKFMSTKKSSFSYFIRKMRRNLKDDRSAISKFKKFQ